MILRVRLKFLEDLGAEENTCYPIFKVRLQISVGKLMHGTSNNRFFLKTNVTHFEMIAREVTWLKLKKESTSSVVFLNLYKTSFWWIEIIYASSKSMVFRFSTEVLKAGTSSHKMHPISVPFRLLVGTTSQFPCRSEGINFVHLATSHWHFKNTQIRTKIRAFPEIVRKLNSKFINDNMNTEIRKDLLKEISLEPITDFHF